MPKIYSARSADPEIIDGYTNDVLKRTPGGEYYIEHRLRGDRAKREWLTDREAVEFLLYCCCGKLGELITIAYEMEPPPAED